MGKKGYSIILEKALASIKPQQKNMLREAKKTLSEINASLKKEGVQAKAVLGGSFAKGTHLAGDFDVDIFVRFDKKIHGKDDLSGLLEKALINFKPARLHGSRDYFQFNKGSLQYEIVPVIEISKPEEAENVTDCSPLHVFWVSKNINGLNDKIRLAKQFMKGAGTYGAESYIRGFSGHVVDLLVIMNKGFLNLLRAASRWKAPVVIDYLNAHKGRALQKLNPAKTQSPLILIDPVQPERNASASLSKEKFDRFVKAATLFLAKPDLSFFAPKEVDPRLLSKKGPIVAVTAEALDGKEDVVGSKILQAYEAIDKALAEFGVVEKQWSWRPGNTALLVYLLKKERLDPTVTIIGPPSRLTRHAAAFKAKHTTAKEVSGRMTAVEKRSATTPLDVLKPIVSSQYIKSRLKRISIRTAIPA